MLLQELLNGMKKQGFTGAGFVIVDDGDKLHLGAYCGDAAQAAGFKAGDLLRDLAALAGGKGGGKPDQAQVRPRSAGSWRSWKPRRTRS